MQSRYQAITDFALHNGNSYFVQTDYLREGILVNGTWYPVIKMEWVTGSPLNRYIESNIADVGELSRMAGRFRKLVRDLAGYGIAHGDLQHGNILAHSGTLRVIDYDGMYLPSIACFGGNNSGHPNYQHPGRNVGHFSASIDNFSAIVIYTGILALSHKPSLWQKYNNDENILFRQNDFINPDKSPLLRELQTLASPLPEYAAQIIGLCRCDVSSIPSLEDFLAGSQPTISITPAVYRPRSPYMVFSAVDSGAILEQTGRRVEIVGQVKGYHRGTTRYGKPYLFLNMTQRYPYHSFTVVLWSEALGAFGAENNPLRYLDQWVTVTGVVEAYNGKPQIAVEVPSQITQLGDEAEAKDRLSITDRTLQLVVPSGVRPKQEPDISPPDPLRELRSKESQTFNRLYADHKQTAPAQPIVATATQPTLPPSGTAQQKPTTQTGFWERLRRFLAGT